MNHVKARWTCKGLDEKFFFTTVLVPKLPEEKYEVFQSIHKNWRMVFLWLTR